MRNIIIIIIGFAAAALTLVGCKSIKFEKIEKTPMLSGTNVVAVQERAMRGTYYAYGIENSVEGLEVSASPTNGIAVKINKVDYDVSAKHEAIIKASLSGAAELATKIGAAIATAGGTACADSISGLIAKFISAGGDASKASVSCKDGSCTITDGATTCTGDSCYYKGE